MNRILSICIAVLLVLSCSRCAFAKDNAAKVQDGVSVHGGLRVSDGKLTDSSDEPFQLRVLSTHGICWYPEYTNAGAMLSIKEAGGNAVRLAMYTAYDEGYLADPERNTWLMIQAIENARAMDLYVIVDWHILEDGDPNEHLKEAITFFDKIASSYPGDPAVIYEVCNEPNSVSWEDISKYAYSICPVIRQYSPDALIILGTPSFSQDLSGALISPPEIDNLMYSYHYYAGEMAGFKALQNAVENGLPVIVSEWGIGKDKNGAPALQDGKSFTEFINENGVSWFGWALSPKDEVYSMLRTDCTKLSGWGPEDLTETGALMFDALKGGGR